MGEQPIAEVRGGNSSSTLRAKDRIGYRSGSGSMLHRGKAVRMPRSGYSSAAASWRWTVRATAWGPPTTTISSGGRSAM
jgi:hypothetical protein